MNYQFDMGKLNEDGTIALRSGSADGSRKSYSFQQEWAYSWATMERADNSNEFYRDPELKISEPSQTDKEGEYQISISRNMFSWPSSGVAKDFVGELIFDNEGMATQWKDIISKGSKWWKEVEDSPREYPPAMVVAPMVWENRADDIYLCRVDPLSRFILYRREIKASGLPSEIAGASEIAGSRDMDQLSQALYTVPGIDEFLPLFELGDDNKIIIVKHILKFGYLQGEGFLGRPPGQEVGDYSKPARERREQARRVMRAIEEAQAPVRAIEEAPVEARQVEEGGTVKSPLAAEGAQPGTRVAAEGSQAKPKRKGKRSLPCCGGRPGGKMGGGKKTKKLKSKKRKRRSINYKSKRKNKKYTKRRR